MAEKEEKEKEKEKEKTKNGKRGKIDWEVLDTELDPSRVLTRPTSFGEVQYLAAWDIIDTANRIFGYDKWSFEVLDLAKVIEGNNLVGYRCTARVTILNNSKPIVREDVGLGMAQGNNKAELFERAIKAAVSDALKRCFRTFGPQFGLYLYRREEAQDGDGNGNGSDSTVGRGVITQTMGPYQGKREEYFVVTIEDGEERHDYFIGASLLGTLQEGDALEFEYGVSSKGNRYIVNVTNTNLDSLDSEEPPF